MYLYKYNVLFICRLSVWFPNDFEKITYIVSPVPKASSFSIHGVQHVGSACT